MAQFGFDFYRFDLHRFDQTPIIKVLEDYIDIESLGIKGLSKNDLTEIAAIADEYILTASPNARERPRVLEELVRQVVAKRKTEAVIAEEFEIKKALLPAYTFVGVDDVRVRHNNLTISDSINDRVSTCSFEVVDPPQAVVDACYFRSPIRVLMIDGDEVQYFGGRVREAPLVSDSPLRVLQVEAEDYTAEAADFVVTGDYSGNIRDVVETIWNEFYERPFVFAMEETDETIEIRFNYEPLDKATEYIISQLGWSWYVDFDGAQRIFRAFPPEFHVYEGVISQKNLNVLAGTPEFKLSDDIANAIYLFGGQGISEPINQQIMVDGENNVYTLAYSPVELQLWLNDQKLNVGVENLHKFDEGYDVLMNYNEKTIQWPEGDEPPQGAVIYAEYKYRYPVVVYAEDKESIATYGKSVKRINDDKVINPLQARQVVERELEKKARPKLEGSLETTALGIRAGMYLSVNLPLYKAQGIFRVVQAEKYLDGDMIINRISLNRVSDSVGTLADKLKELAQRIDNLETRQREDIVVQRFFTVGEDLELSDEITITLARAGVVEFEAARWDFGVWA